MQGENHSHCFECLNFQLVGNLTRPGNRTLSQLVVSMDLAYSKVFRRISGKEQDLIWSLDSAMVIEHNINRNYASVWIT